MKPSIFIGSSTENLQVAFAVQSNLQDDADVTVWRQGIFELSKTTLESLLGALGTSDFAVFVFAPDDVTRIRGTEKQTARDNIVFELGLFIGRAGRERAFILLPRGIPDFHLPTDLAGITTGTYDPHRSNLEAALGPCCNDIRKALRRLGPLDSGRPEHEPRIKNALYNLIQVAARLSALRADLDVNQVRAFCHLYDKDLQQLIPYVMYTGIRIHNDARVPIPCSGTSPQEEWFVISKAFRKNTYCCEDVDWDANIDEIEGAREIWRDVKAIAGHPIRPHDKNSNPIGTVCCDSSKAAQEIGWAGDPDLQDILALIADAVYKLLRG